MTTLATHTLRLTDRIDEIQERLEEIEEEKARLEDLAREAREEDGTIPNDVEDDWDDLDAEETELRGELKKFQMVKEEWGERPTNDDGDPTGDYVCEWTVRELSFGQLQAVSDDMMEESFEVDVERGNVEGTPKQGYYQIELLREAIEEQPPGAPTRKKQTSTQTTEKPAPADYPFQLGEWLFEKVDALNTTGDTDMGNSSLEEALKSKR